MATWLRPLRLLFYLALIGAGLAGAYPAGAQQEGTAPGSAVLIKLDGTIDPNHAKFLRRGIGQAADGGAQLIIVQIDTPGGLGSSMRDMVQTVLESKVPVVTFVSPQGAQAASAGTFVAAAGHVAAMAPGTNIGAASPISGTGEDLPPTLKSKATNDAAALIRSIAEQRGRNVEKLEDTVYKAASYSAQQAWELNVVDLIANDLADLLAKLDGRSVAVDGRRVTLDTDGIRCDKPRVRCSTESLSFVERFIDVISDPNISSLLLTLGSLALLVEIFNPGLVAPGVFGVIALVLAFVSFGNLPVNWAGAGLVMFGAVLLFLELHVAGFGVLGVGGIISFILGIIFLFEPWAGDPPSISGPGVSPSPWVIGGLSGGFGALFGTLFLLAWRGKRAAAPGVSPLIGQTGRVSMALAPVGTVQLGGEMWSAEEENRLTVEAGEQVEVVAVEGLVLKVVRRPKLLPHGEGHALPPGVDGGQTGQ